MTVNPLYGIPSTVTPTPSADVVRWRLRRLADAGFDEELAGALAAERDIDLHALLDLVDRGCPPHLASRIMGNRTVGIGSGSHG